MKYIKTFEYSLYKVPYSIIDDIWDELWKNHKFQYPINEPNVIFNSEYDKEHDEMIVHIQKFNGEYMRYVDISSKYFHGTDEDRIEFEKWLNSLNLIQK